MIDACVMINLLATGLEVEISHALRCTWVMSEHAHRETMFLDSPPDADGVRHRTKAEVSRLEGAGRLEVLRLEADWMAAFVQAAAHLPDNDASSVALAGRFELPLATDDPKVRRVAMDLFPAVPLRSTLSILHEAVLDLQLDKERLLRLAQDLRWRGNFLPPRRDPDRDWYLSLLVG